MKLTKRQKLEAAGWKIGGTADFLQLSLSKSLKQLRQEKQLSQQGRAKKYSV